MQQFLWQGDMQSVVHFVQECLCTLLPDNMATALVKIHIISSEWLEQMHTFLPSFLLFALHSAGATVRE